MREKKSESRIDAVATLVSRLVRAFQGTVGEGGSGLVLNYTKLVGNCSLEKNPRGCNK